MKKRIISVLLATTLVLSMIGCGSSETTETTETTEATEETEEIVLTMWSWSPITRTAEKMIEAFEEENPGITIEYTNYNYDPEYLAALAAASASDNLPDIIALQPGSLTQQYKDYVIDYSSYAEESWGEDWIDNFYEISGEQIQLGNAEGDDGCYILPIESQVIDIRYNASLFEELGLEEPTTYEELVEVSTTLTDNGYAPLYFGGADGWQHINLYLMVISQLDTEIFDQAQNGEVDWTDETFIQACENYQKLFDDGVIQVGSLSTNSYPDGVNLFTAGTAGMMALGSWWTQEYTADDVADTVENWVFDSFYLPAISDDATTSTAVGGVDFGYAITTNCDEVDAAWIALESFCSGAGMQAIADDLNNLPAFKGIEPDASELPETIVEQYNSSAADLDSAMNQRIAEPTIDTAWQNALMGLAAGEMTPEEVVQAVQDAQDAL